MLFYAESTAKKLIAADAIQAIGFYANKGENKPPELGCRVWGTACQTLTFEQAKVLADELNAAIKPVTDAWRDRLLQTAAGELKPFQREYPAADEAYDNATN